jgi:hypothetical protein
MSSKLKDNLGDLSLKNFRRMYKSEDTRFVLAAGFKVMSVALIVMLFIIYMFWVMLSFNNVFFEANGYLNIGELRQAYFDFVLNKTIYRVHYFLAFFIGLFVAGVYIGKILLRPFEIIGNYCEKSIEDINEDYTPDIFSDFKLLTRFSDFFFEYLKESRVNKKLEPKKIPDRFTRIHGPVFDRVFFFHFLLFISIISLISSIVVLVTTIEIYESIIELAIKTLSNKSTAERYFFNNQVYIFESIQWMSILSIVISYLLLALHLYSKVSGAVFGIFSTMRSFMKGNHYNRVHLVGYRHIRPYSRSINKYLDYMQKNFSDIKKAQ